MMVSKNLAVKIARESRGNVIFSSSASGVYAYGRRAGFVIRMKEGLQIPRLTISEWNKFIELDKLNDLIGATKYDSIDITHLESVAFTIPEFTGTTVIPMAVSSAKKIAESRNGNQEFVRFEPFGPYIKASDEVVLSYLEWDKWPFEIPREAFKIVARSDSTGRMRLSTKATGGYGSPARSFMIETETLTIWG